MSIYRSFPKILFPILFLSGGCLSAPKADLALPPANPESICSIISWLSADNLEGRDIGTTGLQLAEGYILGRLQFLNLAPAGENNTYIHTFSTTLNRSFGLVSRRREIQLHNIVAKIPGRGADADECIVLMAHYDHIGRGEMGRSTSLQVGEIHNGADDNASGVAAVLELARILSEKPHNNRTILFLFTSAEEEGVLGSKAWIRKPTVPLEQVKAVINFDMVGRLTDNQVALIASETSPAFGVFPNALINPRGVNILPLYPHGGTPDDLAVFHKARIPGLEFWTGYHPDYHGPTDDIDKINCDGASWIVDLAAQVVRILDKVPSRKLTFAPSPNPPATRNSFAKTTLGFRASARIMRGFHGVSIAVVYADSPAEAAGLKIGDTLLYLNNQIIYNASDIAMVLNSVEPHKPIPVRIRRDNEILELSVTPVPREE